MRAARPIARIAPILLLAVGAGVVLAVAALSWSAPPPVRGPVARPSPHGVGPDRLVLDTVPPTDPVAVLWLEGWTTQPNRTAGSRLALDPAGGVVSIDSRFQVSRPPLRLGGREATSVAPATGGGWWLTDAGGNLIRADARGQVVSAAATPFSCPSVAGDPSSGEHLDGPLGGAVRVPIGRDRLAAADAILVGNGAVYYARSYATRFWPSRRPVTLSG